MSHLRVSLNVHLLLSPGLLNGSGSVRSSRLHGLLLAAQTVRRRRSYGASQPRPKQATTAKQKQLQNGKSMRWLACICDGAAT